MFLLLTLTLVYFLIQGTLDKTKPRYSKHFDITNQSPFPLDLAFRNSYKSFPYNEPLIVNTEIQQYFQNFVHHRYQYYVSQTKQCNDIQIEKCESQKH